jgi:hypothetical protein
MGHWKGFARKRRYYPGIFLEELWKITKHLRIAGLRASIWSRDLPNTNQECKPLDPDIHCCCSSELRRKSWISSTLGRTPWTNDQPVEKASNYTEYNTKTRTNMHALSGIQTHDLIVQTAKTFAPDRMATGIGVCLFHICYNSHLVSWFRKWCLLKLQMNSVKTVYNPSSVVWCIYG